MNAPCRNCPDRHPICHDSCPRYQEFRAERDEISRRKAELAELSAERDRRFVKYERDTLMKRKRLGK